jgi:nitrite reductase/ring-hydroxylating ferredoxin subunit
VSEPPGNSWHVIGTADEFAHVGDFRVRRLADRDVIVVREVNSVLVLGNVCRHEQLPVVGPREAGNTKVFVCPFHGWSFARDGRYLPALGFARTEDAERNLERYPAIEKDGLVYATVAATTARPPDIGRAFGRSSDPYVHHVTRSWTDVLDELCARPEANAIAPNAVLLTATDAHAERALVAVSSRDGGDDCDVTVWMDLTTPSDDSGYAGVIRRRFLVDDLDARQFGGGTSPT